MHNTFQYKRTSNEVNPYICALLQYLNLVTHRHYALDAIVIIQTLNNKNKQLTWLQRIAYLLSNYLIKQLPLFQDLTARKKIISRKLPIQITVRTAF
jgi:hypothetical protein